MTRLPFRRILATGLVLAVLSACTGTATPNTDHYFKENRHSAKGGSRNR